jgi:predicted nucleic acid-binding protein
MSDPLPRLVVDSSVAVKWFVTDGEDEVAEAWKVLESHRAGTCVLAAPAILRLEVLNALWRRQWPEEKLVEASSVLEGFCLEWHEIDAPAACAAASLAARYGITLYDAASATLAAELDAELITADLALARSGACRARMLGELAG